MLQILFLESSPDFPSTQNKILSLDNDLQGPATSTLITLIPAPTPPLTPVLSVLDLKSPRHLSIHDLYLYHFLYLGCTADTSYHAPPHSPGLYSKVTLFFFFWQGEGFLIALCKCVTECKFECPTYGEVKQIETSEFGGERGLLQGQLRRMGGLC